MSQFPSVIAFLSAKQESYERLQVLLSQSHQRQFQVKWLDIGHIDLVDEALPQYDIFLGDAPLSYLWQQFDVLQNKICFWLTDSEITQTELLHQPITDCFLWSEFSGDLLSHCLRRHQPLQTSPKLDPLAELKGDRFQTLINNIPGAVYRCLHNKEWQGMYISDAIKTIVGYPAADFSPTGDRSFDSIIHPDDLDLFNHTLDTHLANQQPFDFEYRLIHRDGSIRWINERGQGVFDQAGNLLWIDGVLIEITSQKKYLDQVTQQQLTYYEKTPAMLHTLNHNGEIIAVSDRWLEVMGYSREEVIGRKSIEFLTSQSQEFAKKMFALFYKQGFVKDVEYQFIKKNGEIIDILLSGIMDDSGLEHRALAVLVDVTDRNRLTAQVNTYQARLYDLVRQRTNALATSETRLRSIFDCAPIGIAETDLAGQFRFTNKRFAEMLGVESIELLSRSVFDVTYDPDHSMSAEIVRQFREGERSSLTCEKRYLRSDGSWFWGSLSLAAVNNLQGEIEYLIATVEDIHERKSAEEALRDSEHRLATAQKISKLAVWEWDLLSQDMYWSPECFELFGYEVDSLEPTKERFMALIHPEDLSHVSAAVEHVLSGGKHNSYETYRIITPAGKTKFVKEYIETVRNADDEVVFIRGATQDITTEMSMIAALEKSDAQLAKMQAIAQIRVWEWDLVNDKTYWSDNSYEIFGIEPYSLDPSFENFLSLVHEDDRPSFLETVQQIMASDQTTGEVEYRLVIPTGDVKFVRDLFSIERDKAGKALHLRGLCQDITKYQEMIAALEKSEARLARAQAIAKVGYWEWDIRQNTTTCSAEIYQIFDKAPNSSALDYDEYLNYIHPSDRERVDHHVQQFLAGQVDGQLEYRIITEKGVVKHIFDQMELKRDADGDVTHLICSTQDITEFHQKTVALKESEDRLAEAQQIAKLGYWERDFRTNQLYWSEASYEIFGVDPKTFQLTYETFLAAVHPDDLSIINEREQLFLNCGRDDVALVEFRIITPTGLIKHLQSYFKFVRDDAGEVIGFRGTNYDVTKDKQAIAALATSEARLAKAQRIAKIGVWDWELATDTLTWSNEFYLLFDLEPQSVEPDFDLFISMVEPGDRPRIFEAIEILNAGEKVYGFEYRINTSKAQKIVVEHVDAITNEAGEIVMFSGTLQDVTAFRQVNVALQKSEARFRSIFDQAALGIVQVSLEGQFIIANQAFCDLLGYTQDELLERTWLNISYPNDPSNCIHGVEQFLTSEIQNVVLEKRYVHKQGHLIWVKVTISCIHNEDSEPVCILGLVEDITAYKKASEELAQTQNHYQNLVNGVHAIMYQYSSTRGGIFYSPRVMDILGYDVDYLLANSQLWYDSIHPEDRPKVDHILDNLHEDPPCFVEYRIHDAQGNWHWFSDKSFSIEKVSDDEYIVSGLALDITQQKETDASLRRRLKLETVLAEISNLIIVNNELDFPLVLGLLGKTLGACWMSVLHCQPETTTLQKLGYWSKAFKSPAETSWSTIEISRFPHWLEKWYAQEKIIISNVQDIPDTGRLERETLTDLGIQALVLVPIQDDQGNAWGYLACSSDQAQPPSWSQEDTDLLAIAGDLIYHHLMRQQTRKNLEQAKEKAEAANFAKSQFLTSMSHELRTPLNAILGFTQVMEQSPIFPEEHRRRLEIIAASGQQLLVLINDILELARFEEGQASLNLRLFNLHGLLDDLQKRFQSSGDRPNLQIQIQRSQDLPRYITADQTKLHSVLSHLLSNATKFTHQGQVKLTVEVTSHHPLTIRFSVTDTGIGIKPSEQSQLFQDFVKLEAGDRYGQGSGLGLALSQKFVKLMGSEIKVDSQPNVGSCFSFELQWDVKSATILEDKTISSNETTPGDSILTPSDLQALPAQWRAQFYTAACSARIKTLETLIADIPAEQQAIAQQLQFLADNLDLDTLAYLSQPTELSE